MWNYSNFKKKGELTFEIVRDTPFIDIEAFSIKNLFNLFSKILKLITQVLSINFIFFIFCLRVNVTLDKMTRYSFSK